MLVCLLVSRSASVYMRLSVCLSVVCLLVCCLSAACLLFVCCLSVCLSSMCLSVCLSTCLSVCLIMSAWLCLPDCLSVCPSACLSVCLSASAWLCLSDCICLSASQSVSQSVCLSVCLLVCLPDCVCLSDCVCLTVSAWLCLPDCACRTVFAWLCLPDCVCLSVCCLSVGLSDCFPVCLSVCPFTRWHPGHNMHDIMYKKHYSLLTINIPDLPSTVFWDCGHPVTQNYNSVHLRQFSKCNNLLKHFRVSFFSLPVLVRARVRQYSTYLSIK